MDIYTIEYQGQPLRYRRTPKGGLEFNVEDLSKILRIDPKNISLNKLEYVGLMLTAGSAFQYDKNVYHWLKSKFDSSGVEDVSDFTIRNS
jgi:hypothetical protein